MFCKICGHELKEGTKFCPNCGNIIFSDGHGVSGGASEAAEAAKPSAADENAVNKPVQEDVKPDGTAETVNGNQTAPAETYGGELHSGETPDAAEGEAGAEADDDASDERLDELTNLSDEARARADEAEKEARRIEEESNAAIAEARAKMEEAKAKADIAAAEARSKEFEKKRAEAVKKANKAVAFANFKIGAANAIMSQQKQAVIEAENASRAAEEALRDANEMGITQLPALDTVRNTGAAETGAVAANAPLGAANRRNEATDPAAATAVQTVADPPADAGAARQKLVKPFGYFGLNLLYAIPVIGLIFLIVHSFGKKNLNRRYFALYHWIGVAICLLLAGVGVILYFAFKQSLFVKNLENVIQIIVEAIKTIGA